MPYSAADIEAMADSLRRWRARGDDLRIGFLTVPMRLERSRKYAHQGLLRRLNSLDWGIDRVFNVLPPETADPEREQLIEAANVLQAILMNTVGALDNLARVWCLERGARDVRGAAIPDGHIGLATENLSVRASLSPAFQRRLREADPWFAYLKNYRDAFAHRIPLYIPPRLLRPEDADAFHALEAAKGEAHQARNYERWNQLNDQQSALGRFEPWMTHSLGPEDQRGDPIRFHGQIICDLATVVELGEHMLLELRSLQRDEV